MISRRSLSLAALLCLQGCGWPGLLPDEPGLLPDEPGHVRGVFSFVGCETKALSAHLSWLQPDRTARYFATAEKHSEHSMEKRFQTLPPPGAAAFLIEIMAEDGEERWTLSAAVPLSAEELAGAYRLEVDLLLYNARAWRGTNVDVTIHKPAHALVSFAPLGSPAAGGDIALELFNGLDRPIYPDYTAFIFGPRAADPLRDTYYLSIEIFRRLALPAGGRRDFDRAPFDGAQALREASALRVSYSLSPDERVCRRDGLCLTKSIRYRLDEPIAGQGD